MSEKMAVEVAYALPDKQRIIKLEVDPGTTAWEAVKVSGIEQHFEELSLATTPSLGVWGKAVEADRVLEPGERVEIYRPLQVDPKEVRKARAARAKEARTAQASSDSDASSAS